MARIDHACSLLNSSFDVSRAAGTTHVVFDKLPDLALVFGHSVKDQSVATQQIVQLVDNFLCVRLSEAFADLPGWCTFGRYYRVIRVGI
jgi:hypothetical protein